MKRMTALRPSFLTKKNLKLTTEGHTIPDIPDKW